ncbi:uncharacterized protein LACBIDRAFT_333932 [Laccaria bicolor S238N-H82]|uniref:Predicted protein n=1 Tax=Laccaria bicolor (strain S238N-H82 / ATCC MYA-4686) TaxID=486041 RepID=B0DXK1_LACBS|nr:uncharacterized protein LACBIDRAFT_333932 [Laccaria bicolor S238N-H82]EDR00694.1 predicted protein [Laccaria bicolor S238N-H82]|eukprot:XP_001888703.1 predicted protein [Laccaria bicolor S238N-H82]
MSHRALRVPEMTAITAYAHERLTGNNVSEARKRLEAQELTEMAKKAKEMCRFVTTIIKWSPAQAPPSLEFTAQFIIRRCKVPALSKCSSVLGLLSRRDEADAVAGFASSLPALLIPIRTLHGISAFGPQFCVYTYDTATPSLAPSVIARDRTIIASQARWRYKRS